MCKATSGPTPADVERLLGQGEAVAARCMLDALSKGDIDARRAHDIAQLYMRLDDPARAETFYARAVAAEPDQPAFHYNHSTALIALGRLEEAEAALDRVIAAQPRDYDAWYNRATLRRQTPERNHVAAIERELGRSGLRVQDVVPLCYALAKELEDLGAFERSFAALMRGARARRSVLSYRVEQDEAIMRGIGAAHSRDWVHERAAGCDDHRPVFVVGLPRSGTTLVDRILSSHGDIVSRGESADFAMALMKAAGPCRDKTELLERSKQLDAHQLGCAYAATLAPYTGGRVIDKTPANFLYLGLIARALPNARIIYVRRRPMDVCYAMYKTLFRMAYPYSYDLDDLGRYWLAFDALMRHWQESLPAGRMLIVDYERLVSEPESTIAAMLEHVGMPWQDACLHFDRNPAPSLTASAAQVRQPLYRTSVGLWQHHARGLAPLANRLRDAGVAIDEQVPG